MFFLKILTSRIDTCFERSKKTVEWLQSRLSVCCWFVCFLYSLFISLVLFVFQLLFAAIVVVLAVVVVLFVCCCCGFVYCCGLTVVIALGVVVVVVVVDLMRLNLMRLNLK